MKTNHRNGRRNQQQYFEPQNSFISTQYFPTAYLGLSLQRYKIRHSTSYKLLYNNGYDWFRKPQKNTI